MRLISFTEGICDCCDGSDEIDSPFQVNCPNTCEQSLARLRKQTLIHYRNIQAGLRAKAEVLQRQKQAKQQNIKTLQNLLEEKEELRKLHFQLTHFLNFESSPETQMRWKLLHERLHNCASGQQHICEDLFASTYFSEDELRHEGFPEIYLNPKQRFVYEYSDDEKLALARSTGLERVRLGICPVRDLLPDQDARIFARLFDYVHFMESTAGTNKQLQQSKRAMQDTTLFARFLENGSRGYVLAGVQTGEVLGLVLSPVLLPAQWLYGFWSDFWAWLPKALDEVVRIPLVREHVTGLPLLYAGARCVKTATIEEGEGEGGADEVYDTTSMEKQCQATFQPHYLTSTTSSLYSNTVVSVSLFYAQQVAQLCLDLQDDKTLLGQLYADYLLDWSRYPALQTFADAFRELFAWPLWLLDIVWRSPQLYVDYYYHQKYTLLPPGRHACLLRQGLATVADETRRVDALVAQEQEKLHLLARYQYAVLTGTNPVTDNNNNNGKKKVKAAEKDEEWVDAGPDGVFDSLRDHCLTVRTTSNNQILLSSDANTEASYEYSLCFFGEVSQAAVLSGGNKGMTTSLGRFTGWHRDHATNEQHSRQPSSKEQEGDVWRTLAVPQQWRDIVQLSDNHLDLQHWSASLPLPSTLSGLSSTAATSGADSDEETTFRNFLHTQDHNSLAHYAYLLLSQYLTTQAFSTSTTGAPSTAGMWTTLFGSSAKPISAQDSVTGWLATSQYYLQHLLAPTNTTAMDRNSTSWTVANLQHHLYGLIDAQYAKYAVLQNLPKAIQQRLLAGELLKYYSRQYYSEGTLCPVRPGFRRSTDVVLECGAELKITSIAEPQVIPNQQTLSYLLVPHILCIVCICPDL